MTVPSPVRIDHAKDALRDLYIDALPTGVPVVWGHQGIPRQKRPFCRLNIVSGPHHDGVFVEEHRARDAITLSTVTVDTAIDAIRYRVRVNGLAADYTASVPPDDVDAIRDALVTAVNLLLEPVTAAATVNPGEFTITPNAAGDLYAVDLAGVTQLSKIDTTADVLVVDTLARNRITVSCDFFHTPDSTLEAGAIDLARRCLTALDLPDNLITLKGKRVAIRAINAISNVTGLEPGGARFESHAAFDVDLHLSSRVSRAIDPIENVEGSIDISGNIQTFTVP